MTTSPVERLRGTALTRLIEQARRGAMQQSVLLVGPEGSGKEAAAIEIAVELLRPVTATPAQGLFGDLPVDDTARAVSERKVRRLAHPDLTYLFPAESKLTPDRYRELLDEKAAQPFARTRQPTSAILPIGDADDSMPVSIRSLRRFVNAAPFEAAHRVAIVADAHRMNRAAANALLKTLEEPPSTAVILLCTHQPHLLPATVRSRCARVQVPALIESDLAALMQAEAGLEPADAARVAAVAAGNARRAFDLVDPAARELATWSDQIMEWLLRGDRVHLARAAERVGKGQSPVGKGGKVSGDASLAVARDVALRVIDLATADLLAVARRDAGARLDPARRDSLPREAVDAEAAFRACRVLLAARADLSRNVNVGLVLVDAFLDAASVLHGRAREANTWPA